MINIQRKHWKLAAVASILVLGFGLASTTASAAGSIKAAYVEQVIPGKSFFGSMTVLNVPKSIGPGTGILGVTSITLTNFDSAAQQVFIFAPVFSGSDSCGSNVIGGGNPQIQVYVQPHSTLQLTYPSPLVINPLNGQTCIAAEVTTPLNGGSVAVVVNGFLN
jgi:hypothetical protein